MNIDPDTWQDFIIWLDAHEDDIAAGINDFGDLRDIFFEVMFRNAGEPIDSDAIW